MASAYCTKLSSGFCSRNILSCSMRALLIIAGKFFGYFCAALPAYLRSVFYRDLVGERSEFKTIDAMKLLVCISKTPDTTTKISFTDNNTKFNSDKVQFIINPYDEWYALVRAIELK